MPSSLSPSPRKRPARRRKPVPATVATIDPRAALACRLDRNADALLFLGCHIAAERLACRAQALQEAGQ